MSLAAFFEQIGPFLEGKESYSGAVARLYGDPPDPALVRDARRLRIYGRFCKLHRHEVIDLVCTETRAQVEALAGAAAWEELIDGYFGAVPMHHAELSANGDGWVDYFAAQVAARGLPGWLAELSDLEQAEFRAGVAADEPEGEPTDLSTRFVDRKIGDHRRRFSRICTLPDGRRHESCHGGHSSCWRSVQPMTRSETRYDATSGGRG